MIDPKKELFKWGPVDGKPIYTDCFSYAFVEYPKFIDGTWPDGVGYFKEGMVTFILEYDRLRSNGEHLFRKYVFDGAKLKKSYAAWIKDTKNIRKFEAFVNRGLSGLSDEKLKKAYLQWNKDYTHFWFTGFLPELSNWGSEQILKKDIQKLYPSNFIEIFEKLGAPEKLSFFQTEELELLKLKAIKDRKLLEKKLKEHQKKYYWLRNNYHTTKVLDVAYFREELENIGPEEARKKIKRIKDYPAEVKKARKEMINKYNIPKNTVNISERLAYCVWWQDYRKRFIFVASHIISCFMREIGLRKGVEFDDLCYYTAKEAEDLLVNGKKVDVKQRLECFVNYYHERKGVSFYEGKEAENFAAPYLEKEIDKNINKIGGMVVSSGRTVRGIARILTTPRHLEKMEKGDILVSPMTSPDYIVAMRKASAVVTDEGGMTCHAAIVSRELKIPCIVQTRVATKVFKDGDMIEVDTEKGIVRKIG